MSHKTPHDQEKCPHLRISASPTEAPYCADCGKKFGSEKPKCSVAACHEDAACELAVDGEWFPVCSVHALNRFMPRRNLTKLSLSNDKVDLPPKKGGDSTSDVTGG